MSGVDVYLLGEPGDKEVAALGHLLSQVSSRARPLTSERVAHVVSYPSTYVLVASLDGSIVGMALLLVCTTLAGEFGPRRGGGGGRISTTPPRRDEPDGAPAGAGTGVGAGLRRADIAPVA